METHLPLYFRLEDGSARFQLVEIGRSAVIHYLSRHLGPVSYHIYHHPHQQLGLASYHCKLHCLIILLHRSFRKRKKGHLESKNGVEKDKQRRAASTLVGRCFSGASSSCCRIIYQLAAELQSNSSHTALGSLRASAVYGAHSVF